MIDGILSLINMQNPANWLQPGFCHYLLIAVFIFLTGLIITISNGNLIKILIGLEFMINAVALNFIATNAYVNSENSPANLANSAIQSNIAENFAPVKSIYFNFANPEGQTIALFVIVIGIINIAAGLALILAVYNKFKNITTAELGVLKSADCPDYDDLKTEDDI